MSSASSEPVGLELAELPEARSNHLVSRLDRESENAKKWNDTRATECNNADSDCESDTSEVLSVGSEPTPTSVVEVRVCGSMRYDRESASSRGEFRDEDNTRTSATPSPSSSTSCNDAYYQRMPGNHISAPSPPGYSQPLLSPTASSVRSPASSSATASSPGRPEAIQEATVPRYQSSHQQHLLSRYSSREPEIPDYSTRVQHGLGHEIVYPNVERLHRTSLSVPLVTRLSLSPPSAMTVTGLQATTPILHPTACRDLRETTSLMPHHSQHLHNVNAHAHQDSQQVQHVPANSVHQHRLSVSKLLQRDPGSPASPGSREDNGRTLSAANGVQNSISTSNNSNHHNNHNNNNNLQHQAGLKFSIDNILKADFGRRITDPISLKKSRPKKVASRPIDLTKDFLELSSDVSEKNGSETTTNTSPTGVSAGNPAPNPPAPTATDPGKMLWPAWVYCTRYSDRPSSGELSLKYQLISYFIPMPTLWQQLITSHFNSAMKIKYLFIEM